MLMPDLKLGKLDALIRLDALYIRTVIGLILHFSVGVRHESVATGFLPARQSPANRCGNMHAPP